jgi:hypothetical protein
MGYKSLAEAVILQSMEDLWNSSHKDESKDFFEGDGFKICAEIAGMDSIKQFKFIHLLGGKTHVRTIKSHNA